MFALSSGTRTDTGVIPVQPSYAPVRHLDSGVLAAIDVQLRGPIDSPFASAGALSDAARAISRDAELDRLKWQVVRDVEPTGVPILISVDLDSAPGVDREPTRGEQRTIIVVPESSFTAHPAITLRAAQSARNRGAIVAVDGIGTRPRSLSLLPVMAPDVIVLDQRLLAARADESAARTAHAVLAHVERVGAVVVAAGIDSELHRRRALGLGAEYGYGTLYPSVRSPQQLADETVDPIRIAASRPFESTAGSTPYELLAAERRPTRSLKRLLITMSRTLEARAAAAGPETILLGTFQHDRHFTAATVNRWQSLAESVAFAGVYGIGMQNIVDSGVHRAPLDPTDRLVDEWTVVVLSPHFCCVLAALDLHSSGTEGDREFSYVTSYDHATVARCARAVLARFTR